jgi:hypothetical protein
MPSVETGVIGSVRASTSGEVEFHPELTAAALAAADTEQRTQQHTAKHTELAEAQVRSELHA